MPQKSSPRRVFALALTTGVVCEWAPALYCFVPAARTPNRRMQRRRSTRNGARGGGSISLSSHASLTPGVTARRYNQAQTGLAPFPFRWDARLAYGVNVAIGTAGNSALAAKHRFRLNSCYDPDVTGTGEQPYQWDQLTAIYTKYIVKSATVELSFNEPSSSGLWVGWSYHTNTTSNDDPAGKTLGDIMSRPNFQAAPVSNYGTETVTMKVKIPVHEVFGLSQMQYLAVTDQYGAAYNANPISEAYLDLFIVDPNALLAAQYVRAVGRIIYEVQLFDYAAPSGS